MSNLATKGGQATSRGKLMPPLKWHIDGGKGYLAPHIHRIARQTTYTHRVITHAGGMGELWDWDYDDVSEVVNDRNGWLTNFWAVLRRPQQFDDLRRRLEATPFSEPEFEVAREMVRQTPLAPSGIDPIIAAALFFVCVRQSMAGRMKDFAPISRTRTRRRMNEQASAWLTAIEGLPAAHARLMRVVIFNKDALEVIRQQDGPDTLFYCDPPYYPTSRTSPEAYGSFEMTPAQHAALLNALGKIQGKFILSGYCCDLYRQCQHVYGWQRHEFDLPNNAAGGATKRRMQEVIWCNFGESEVAHA